MTRTLALVAMILLPTSCTCGAAESTPETPPNEQTPVPGRVTAIAPTIWACPLEGWRLRQDDGCDPIATGTAIKIHRRGVRPEYPHGPFALIEYSAGGTTKVQYVIDNTVTPMSEDDPSVEETIKRIQER